MSRLLVTPYSFPIIYIIVFAVLIVLELIYFRIAEKYGIVDKPAELNPHKKTTIRGGGVIFWFAGLFYFLLHISTVNTWFFVGFTLLAFVSFLDDVIDLRAKSRLVFQFIALIFTFIASDFFYIYPWWIIIIAFFVFQGVINVYNFMDGINGITSFYSISVLLSFQYVNLFVHQFVHPDFIWFPLIACFILLFFNFRKQAKCFLGDVGSVSIGFWIVTLLIMLIVDTNNIVWFGFLMVYGIDGVVTLLHRLYLGDDITTRHRTNLFHILSDKGVYCQKNITLGYFFVQTIVSALIIWLYPIIGWWIFAATLLVLLVVFNIWRFKLMKKYEMRIYKWQEPTNGVKIRI